MSKVTDIYPADSFETVAHNAGKELKCGIIIGYDENGALQIFGGGTHNGQRPAAKDWLWMVESFKQGLIDGRYSDD